MAKCKIVWREGPRTVGVGRRVPRYWTSTDRRYQITHQPGRRPNARYYVVDLDTYNDTTTKTLGAAKRAACSLQHKPRRSR